MDRFMKTMGGTMVYPYDEKFIRNGTCIPLPLGYNPKTGEIDEVTDGTVEEIVVPILNDFVKEEETAVELEPSVTGLTTSIVEDSYDNMTKRELANECESLGIKYSLMDKRSMLLSLIKKYKGID